MNIDYKTVLNAFPKLELSYETLVHKKVHNADIYSAIPDSNPCFLWFTSYNFQNVCFLLDLDQNDSKSLVPVKAHIIQTNFKDHLSFGTILYGHIFKYKHKTANCFSIDNIYFYKGKDVSALKYDLKLEIFKDLLVKDVKQSALKRSHWILGLPVMDTDVNNLLRDIELLPYKVKYIKCRNMGKNETTVFQYYKPGQNAVEINIGPQVFRVKAGLGHDIYNLYTYNIKTNDYEYYDIAFIPDFKTSVLMNGIFRNIKENRNLDLLEESDSEEEFEDERDDKYVDLEKSVKMLCEYNGKFSKWMPKKCVQNKEKVVIQSVLKQNLPEKQKYEKKKYTNNIYVQKYRK